ncbi:hypothetical protein BGP_3990 [Beggiatoa sp. PS]|nr:hypothetical protein BGP_3990 [Beggiatoa sp. PS]
MVLKFYFVRLKCRVAKAKNIQLILKLFPWIRFDLSTLQAIDFIKCDKVELGTWKKIPELKRGGGGIFFITVPL